MVALNEAMNLKFLFLLLTINFIVADVILYPHPAGIRSSDKFTVYVNHQPSFTYISTSDHRAQKVQHAHSHRSVSWTSFSLTRSHAIVEVHTQTDFRQCIVRPKHYGYHCKRTGTKTAQFTIKSNRRMMSVEFDFDYGSMHKDITDKLLIFADPPETSVPKPNTHGVLFYSAGVTDLRGQKHLNATVREVYLAPGAYVHGGFITTGPQSVKIHGRGVLSGERYKFHDSQFNYALINMDRGAHHTVEGLVLVDPPWYFHRALSVHNTIRSMKTVAAWTYNSDGVSLGNNGLVEDSFIMANDDSIKVTYLRY